MKAIDRKHKRDHLKVCRKCLRKDQKILVAGSGYNQQKTDKTLQNVW